MENSSSISDFYLPTDSDQEIHVGKIEGQDDLVLCYGHFKNSDRIDFLSRLTYRNGRYRRDVSLDFSFPEGSPFSRRERETVILGPNEIKSLVVNRDLGGVLEKAFRFRLMEGAVEKRVHQIVVDEKGGCECRHVQMHFEDLHTKSKSTFGNCCYVDLLPRVHNSSGVTFAILEHRTPGDDGERREIESGGEPYPLRQFGSGGDRSYIISTPAQRTEHSSDSKKRSRFYGESGGTDWVEIFVHGTGSGNGCSPKVG